MVLYGVIVCSLDVFHQLVSNFMSNRRPVALFNKIVFSVEAGVETNGPIV